MRQLEIYYFIHNVATYVLLTLMAVVVIGFAGICLYEKIKASRKRRKK